MNLENKNKIYNEAENTVIVEDYDDFEEKIVPSEKLGRGWYWHKYNDGSGYLESPDGKEYKMRINQENKLPTVWAHVLANPYFGTVLTENIRCVALQLCFNGRQIGNGLISPNHIEACLLKAKVKTSTTCKE